MFSHVISCMRRSYGQYGEMKTGKLANVYFHWECAKLVQPAFATLIKGLLKILHNQLSVFILFIGQNLSHNTARPVRVQIQEIDEVIILFSNSNLISKKELYDKPEEVKNG